jgi:membrane-associated phospholipid phosphatase
MARRAIIAFGIALIAIAVASLFDASAARAMRDSGLEDFLRSHKVIRESLKAPGWFGFTLVVAAIVGFVHRETWRASIFLILAALMAGLNQLLKWVVGRTRPFKFDESIPRLAPFEFRPFYGGKNLCFPSGHAALAFATAAALGMLFPRLRPLWYGLASLVAIERFAENAHWFSDCVAGAALGIGGAYLMAWLIRTWKINLPTSRPTSHPTSRS